MKDETTRLRVRYSETDQMGTFYNSRALEWFEVGRTEWLRSRKMPYAEMESRGVMLPLVEAHLEFFSRAVYDDELSLSVNAEMVGKARVRFNVSIAHTGENQQDVVRGYTTHAVTDGDGRPTRPPRWFIETIGT